MTISTISASPNYNFPKNPKNILIWLYPDMGIISAITGKRGRDLPYSRENDRFKERSGLKFDESCFQKQQDLG